MQITDYLRTENIAIITPAPATATAFLRRVADHLAGEIAADTIFAHLSERERLGSTAIAPDVAIPHCKIPGLHAASLALFLVPEGVDFGAAEGKPTHLFFVIVSPESGVSEHLQILAKISRLLKATPFVAAALAAANVAELQALLEKHQ